MPEKAAGASRRGLPLGTGLLGTCPAGPGGRGCFMKERAVSRGGDWLSRWGSGKAVWTQPLSFLGMSLFAGGKRRSSPYPLITPPQSAWGTLLPPVPVPLFLCYLVPFNKRSGTTFSRQGLEAVQVLGEHEAVPAASSSKLGRGPGTERPPPARQCSCFALSGGQCDQGKSWKTGLHAQWCPALALDTVEGDRSAGAGLPTELMTLGHLSP